MIIQSTIRKDKISLPPKPGILSGLENPPPAFSEARKFLNEFTPLFNAAISQDPAFKGVKFKPLPQFELPKKS